MTDDINPARRPRPSPASPYDVYRDAGDRGFDLYLNDEPVLVGNTPAEIVAWLEAHAPDETALIARLREA